jgi:hypothetical protein
MEQDSCFIVGTPQYIFNKCMELFMLQMFKTEHFGTRDPTLQIGQICGHLKPYSKITPSGYPSEKFKEPNVQKILKNLI